MRRLVSLLAVLALLAVPSWAAAHVYFRSTIQGSPTRLLYRPGVIPFGERSALVKLSWQRWGGTAASGRGKLEYNPCTPNCAYARPQYYRVTVRLSRIHRCGRRRLYSRMFFRFVRDQPQGLPRSHTEQYGCL